MKDRIDKLHDLWLKNVGRRGTALFIFSVWLINRGYLLTGIPTRALLDNLQYAVQMMPLNYWGTLFMVVGVLGVVASIRKQLEAIAFSALLVCNGSWALFYLFAFLSGSPGTGNQVIAYSALSALTFTTSSMAEIKRYRLPTRG